MKPRLATIQRQTRETSVTVTLNLDGQGTTTLATGLPFLDHMLDAMARHGRMDLTVEAKGDLLVDDHHTVEDVALTLGAAIDQALDARRGIARFGEAHVAMDEALARAVIDCSGRPFASVALGFRRERLGAVATENLTHFFQSLSQTGRFTLHLDLLRGDNDHHRAEAAFKAVGIALLRAAGLTGLRTIPSTKGSL